jgi:hypothetical protein
MASDSAVFIQFAVKAGYERNEALDESAHLNASQLYLEYGGHAVWNVQEALQRVHDDADVELSAQLLEQLIYWFFITRL